MRHAVYFTPPAGSALHALGTGWLGRDAAAGKAVPQPHARLEEVTRHPARYGFHATLKPPFRFKSGASLQSLEKSVQRLVREHRTVHAGDLQLAVVDGFLALVLDAPCPDLDALAGDCVTRLDDFRLPPDDAELARRRSVGLTPAQDANLQRWGYPYVLEEFRFHMTLTDRLSAGERAWIDPLARAHFAAVLGKPLIIDAVTIMTEPAAGAPLTEHLRLPLVSTSQRAA